VAGLFVFALVNPVFAQKKPKLSRCFPIYLMGCAQGEKPARFLEVSRETWQV
jgi:hypothetical protein